MTKEELLKQYPIGTKVELVEMDDFQAPPIGTRGVVNHIDDMLTIFVSWETGSGLGVVYGVDKIKKI